MLSDNFSRAVGKKALMEREILDKCVYTWFLLSSLVNELALTARKMYADEAKSSGLVR